jgi:hypothetical protein
MRDTAHRWQQWRVTLAEPTPPELGADRFARVACPAAPLPLPLSATAEEPGPDGVRHDLVARVKLAIEAGYYDGDDIWDRTEAKLLRDAGCE